MAINFNGAVEAVREALESSTPCDEAQALELAQEALAEYVDGGLVYTRDILDLWDGSTHDVVVLSDGYDDIMGAVTASVYWQTMEAMDDAIFDGVDAWIASELTRLGLADEFEDGDRDEQIAAIYDAL